MPRSDRPSLLRGPAPRVAAGRSGAARSAFAGAVALALALSGPALAQQPLRTIPGKAVPGLLRDLTEADVALESIEVLRPTLDDVFLSLTGRSLRDADAATEDRTPATAGKEN